MYMVQILKMVRAWRNVCFYVFYHPLSAANVPECLDLTMDANNIKRTIPYNCCKGKENHPNEVTITRQNPGATKGN